MKNEELKGLWAKKMVCNYCGNSNIYQKVYVLLNTPFKEMKQEHFYEKDGFYCRECDGYVSIFPEIRWNNRQKVWKAFGIR